MISLKKRLPRVDAVAISQQLKINAQSVESLSVCSLILPQAKSVAG